MIQDLTIKKEEITFGLDSIIVRKFTNGIFGGVMLDCSNYPLPTILAGHVVITDGEVYRPMPISLEDEVYDDLPEGFHYFGVVYRSSRVNMGVSVMISGAVNRYRVPYELEVIEEEFTKQCPHIILACDVEEMDSFARLEASDGVVYTSDGKEVWFRTGKENKPLEGV